jgi:hypothetical protein
MNLHIRTDDDIKILSKSMQPVQIYCINKWCINWNILLLSTSHKEQDIPHQESERKYLTLQ